MWTPLIQLGLTASGALQVPPTASIAGWYTGSPRPGATGSAVIAGHIDSYLGPGVFFGYPGCDRVTGCTCGGRTGRSPSSS